MIKGITGVGNSEADRKVLLSLDKVLSQDRHTAITIGGAHTLAYADEAIVGDPIEK